MPLQIPWISSGVSFRRHVLSVRPFSVVSAVYVSGFLSEVLGSAGLEKGNKERGGGKGGGGEKGMIDDVITSRCPMRPPLQVYRYLNSPLQRGHLVNGPTYCDRGDDEIASRVILP